MRKSVLSTIVALACVGGGNASEDINSSKENIVSLESMKVISATGYEQNIADAPASISVITSEEIQKSSYMNIKDVLSDTVGINISSFRDKGTNDISIRGLDPKYTLYMINGKPIVGREVAGGFANGITPQTLPPLNMIERIEVIRGPMSSLYGSEAVGGMINIITKKVSNEWIGGIDAQFNKYQNSKLGSYWNTGLYVSGPLVKDTLGLEVNGLISRKNEDDKPDWQPKNDVKNAGAKLIWKLTSNDDLGFEYKHSKNDVVYTDKSDWSYEGHNKKDTFIIDHEGKYGDLRWQSFLSYDKTKYFGTLGVNPDFKQGGNFDTLMFDTKGTYFSNKNTLTVGLNYKNEKFSVIEDPNTYKIWNAALYAEDDFSVTDDLILTFGARLNKNKNYGTHFSPRLYANYYINNNFVLKGGVSTGYINPELTASSEGAAIERGAGVAVTLGNPKLKPESSINYEAGFAYTDEKMYLSLMGFYSVFKDKIDDFGITCEDGDRDDESTWTCSHSSKKYYQVLQYVNLGKTESKGIELAFNYKILSNLKLNSSYFYVIDKFKTGEEKGEITRQMPHHNVNLGLSYDPIESVNVWTRANYKSKEKDKDNAWGIRYGKPSYTVVDLGLVYKVNKNLNINAGVYNIFDTKPTYLTNSSKWGKISDFVDERRFMVGFNASF